MSSIRRWIAPCKALISNGHDGVLADACIDDRARELGHRWRDSFWSPAMTLRVFLLQVLSAEKTLRAAVAQLLAHLVCSDPEQARPSADPSAYSQARQRLPAKLLSVLLSDTAAASQRLAGDSRVIGGRRILIVDGSSISMPDTPELQEALPQSPQQAPGCGFPMARISVLFCWRTGALLDCRMDSMNVAELPMFRSMLDQLQTGDIIIADRLYNSYTDIARLAARGVDSVTRIHKGRPADFGTGTPLGPDDNLVEWTRPEKPPEGCGLSREEFNALPERMILRMVRRTTTLKGFRSQTIVIITTILDPKEASADELLALYRDRWMAELNLRHLKTTLSMDVLRTRSLEMVKKELLAHLIGYNLLRLLMWDAATREGRDPQRMSFAGTLHRLRTIIKPLLFGGISQEVRDALVRHFLEVVAEDEVPLRPGRVEPRCVKRRAKPYPRLQVPRAQMRARCTG
jgi:hypothetical protein